MISKVIFLIAIASMAVGHPPLDHSHHASKPYKFGYSIKDKHGEQHREESGDGGHHVTGSYGFTDDRGIHRQVNYVADHGGFRAEVKTNEPGTANQNPAAIHIASSAPAYGHLYGGYGGPGSTGLGYARYGGLGNGYGGIGNGYESYGAGYGGLGYGAGYGGLGYGAGYGGLGYGAGYGGLGYGAGYGGLGYGAGYGGLGYGGYGLASALLGTLPYARYGY